MWVFSRSSSEDGRAKTENNSGYGQTPRCSPLQQQWQTSHPTFIAIKQYPNIRIQYREKERYNINSVSDPALLTPLASPAVFITEPRLIDYVQLPLYLWIPDFFLPHLVQRVPCPEPECQAETRRVRWRSGGPRVIHGIRHAMYLHGWDYTCTRHKNSFTAWDPRCLQRMPIAARRIFTSQFGSQQMKE